MEKKILNQAIIAIDKAIVDELVGYGKPLSKLTEKVIEANSDELFDLLNNEFVNLMKSNNFKVSLREALNQKLAKTLISKMGGSLESRINELKQNPQTRAKITLAISEIIDGL